MEIKFNKTVCPCLNQVLSQIQTQEQTQEVRLPEMMPDIGRVLGCWGQVLVRGKEWRGGSMAVSGGVLAWVLYAPENGSEVRSVDTWIPFQMRWELPQTQRDGSICVLPLLKSMDARSTSARKLMVRANVSILGEALEPVDTEISVADDLGPDVELLRSCYPSELPRESGERLFEIDEELTLPGTMPKVRNILRYDVQPMILEQKVMAGRLVFRGKCLLHLLYDSESGIHSWDTEVPFSQYAELDRDQSPNATAWIIPMVTGVELSCDDQNHLQLKCGIAAQYVIFDRVMVEIVEDAYSPARKLELQTQELKLPMRLDTGAETVEAHCPLDADAERIVDLAFLPDHPAQRQNGNIREFALPGQFQVLYVDREGNMQSSTLRTEGTWQSESDPGNQMNAYVYCTEPPQAVPGPQGMDLSARWTLDTETFGREGLSMVTCITMGEAVAPDPARPSLILRRATGSRLWDIAKDSGSTVDAIKKANGLQEEPERGKMLLIPIP